MAGRNKNRSRTSRKTSLEVFGYESTGPRIRWKPEEKTELARLVRNYNQKRRRAIARGIPETALPGVVRGRELRDKVINTRKDLKREMGELERFMKADLTKITDYGNVRITEYEMKEAERLARIGNRALAKERERLEKLGVTSFGKAVTYNENGTEIQMTIGQMGRIKNNEFAPVTIDVGKNTERWQWNKTMDMLRKRADPEYINKRNHLLQMNYLIALHRTMGTSGYTLAITEKVLEMSPQQFANYYYGDTDVTNIEYIYDEHIDERIERLKTIFEGFSNEPFNEFDRYAYEPTDFSDKTINFLKWFTERESKLNELDF